MINHMQLATRRLASSLPVVLVFVVVYGIWFVAAPPRGEFPLNDDWAYAWSVRHLLQTGELRISDWTSATAILQVILGALSAKLGGGFSFTALRWSTLIVSFVGCLALYDLLQQLGAPALSALLAGLALAANPMYVYLSYTFMSDVFYFSMMLLSLGFYVRGLKHDAEWALFAGSIFAGLSYLSRQLGVTLPAAIALAIILKQRRIRWRSLLMATLIPVLIIVSHTIWLRYFHGLPWGLELNAVQNSFKVLLQPTLPLNVIWRLLLGMLYMGIFTLPVMAAAGLSLSLERERLIRLGKIFGVWLVALGVSVAAVVYLTGIPMPYLANVINREGIGVLSLAGKKSPITPDWVFWLVTAVSPFAGAAQGALWTEVALNVRREGSPPAGVLLIASALMAALTAIIIFMWDEYLLVFIPAGLYLALRLGPLKTRGWVVGFTVCAAMLVYSLYEMSDHMAWNAARWAAGEKLVAQGIAPEAIDGGFEWVGWYEFETALPVAIARGQKDNLFAWLTVTPDQYRLAFEPLKGYTVFQSVTYHVPVFGREAEIYILQPLMP